MNALTLPERAAVALGATEYEAQIRDKVASSADITAITNAAGRDQAHRVGMELVKLRTGIRAAGKSAREDATAFSKSVIAEEARLVALIEPEESRVIGLRDAWDQEIEAEKARKIAAERARVEAIQRKIQEIRMTPSMAIGWHSVEIRGLAARLTVVPFDATFFQEFIDEVRVAATEAQVNLGEMATAREVIEAQEEQARRDAIFQKAEREAEAARIAAERLQIECDRAELAERAAEQDRIAKAAHAAAQADLAAERAETDRIRKLEDVARALQAKQERELLESQHAAARLEQAKLDRIAAQQEAERQRLQTIADQHRADELKRQLAAAPVSEPVDAQTLLIAALQNCHGYLTGRHHNRGDAIVRIELALFAVGQPCESDDEVLAGWSAAHDARTA
jgi:hypothetical protein